MYECQHQYGQQHRQPVEIQEVILVVEDLVCRFEPSSEFDKAVCNPDLLLENQS